MPALAGGDVCVLGDDDNCICFFRCNMSSRNVNAGASEAVLSKDARACRSAGAVNDEDVVALIFDTHVANVNSEPLW